MEQECIQTGIGLNNFNEVDEQQNVQRVSTVSESYNESQKQLQWTDGQITTLERQLLLNNCNSVSKKTMSNWTKVFLCTLSVMLPGIGQLIGIIIGLVMVSNDSDSDKRTYGAALITVSIVVFIILLAFWFLFALALSPQLYY